MHNLYEELEKTCERMEKELCDFNARLESNKAMISAADIDLLDKITHTIKSVKKTMELLDKDYEIQNGYSGNYSGNYMSQPMWDRHYAGNSYRGTYTMDTGYSGRRGMSRGYSRDSEKDDIIRRLEDALNRTKNESDANAIRDSIEAINRL